jgi:hypothetical protein
MLKLIVWIFVALLALSFFGISIQRVVEGPTAQANFHFLFDLLLRGFNYLVDWITQLLAPVRAFIHL